MRYPPAILDDIRARLSVSHVVGRKVALKKAGREFRGLSPFKTEKSPSFFVNDQKGFYHCFASGEHGDIFTFVMKTEGLSFPEAVERLASEAGVALPKPTEFDKQAVDGRTRLYELLDCAARFFEARLAAPDGATARRYVLEKRGLRRETVQKFRLGFAPAGRSVLKDHLAAAGYTVEEMVASGMLIGGDDIPVPYDRFRNRVMFPIADLKGRVIAFGGRALDADAPAKYLNSPETPLFHKGVILFNAARARPIAHTKGQLIVVEGYMDVVALDEAGFGHAVAPLGTALTEGQIALLWRMVPEPTLCFDGDNAGKKAAFRAVETVLPGLKAGYSLSFAFLPDGLDPDDLVRQQGAEAMRAVLERTKPLSTMLFEREQAQGDWSTPERRARLEQQIWTQLKRIGDERVRGHYADAMKARLAELWGRSGTIAVEDRQRGASPRGQWNGPPKRAFAPSRGGSFQKGGGRFQLAGPDPRTTRSSSLKGSAVVAGPALAVSSREALILRTLITHPWLLEQAAETLAELEFASPALQQLRDGILTVLASDNSLDTSDLLSQLGRLGLGALLATVDRAITHDGDRFAKPGASHVEVEAGWRDVIAVHRHQFALQRELDAAERAYRETAGEEHYERICEIKQAMTDHATPSSGEDAFAGG